MARVCPQLGVGCRACLIATALAAAFAGGCSGRFRTSTEYLAEGFTRDSLRGRTIALMLEAAPKDSAEPPGNEAIQQSAVIGVARGMRQAGARVRVVAPPPQDHAAAEQVRVILASVYAAPNHPPNQPSPPSAIPGAGYTLIVRLEGSEEYRRYVRRPGGLGQGPAASRTSGRRVRLRLALLRASDGAALWLASGSGELWNTRSAETGDDTPAATLAEDLRRGHRPLYPPPPDAQAVARRLTHRLLAHVPNPVEVQPN